MWTGRQTLSSIENAVAKLHGEEGQLDGGLRSAVEDAERLRKERGDALRELARIKLDEMTAGKLIANLDAGERRAAQILDDYRMRIAVVTERREALLKEVTAAEAERHAAASAVEAALEAVDGLRAQAEASVQATAEWRAAKTARDAADAIASESEKKAAASEAELGAKKQPYDDDLLFAYLWRRRFGTREYAGTGIARAIDRMVAEFVRYDEARPNYATLIEIPLRLREHAMGKRAALEQPQAVLSQIERRAMVMAGVEAKEKALAEARHRLAALDDTVEKKHGLLRDVDHSRATLVSGATNPAYDEALSTIVAADSKDDLHTLYMEARRTPTTEDEAAVSRLEAIDATISKTDGEIARLRAAMVELSRRRAEVEQVRDKFRRTGYDHPQSTFNNDGDIRNVLGGILEGAVRSGVLWDLFRQGHGSRPTRGGADFGSPSFPFPFPLPGDGYSGNTRGGGWRNNPSSRGGWVPNPSGSGSDDEKFSTGGNF